MKKRFEIIKKDDELGEFVLDKRFNYIQGEVNWRGNTCDIYLKHVDDLNNYEVQRRSDKLSKRGYKL